MSELPSSATPPDAAPEPTAPSAAGTAAPVPGSDPVVATAAQEGAEAAPPVVAEAADPAVAPPAVPEVHEPSAPDAAPLPGEGAAASHGDHPGRQGRHGGQPKSAGGHAQGDARGPGRQDVPDCGPQLRQQFPALFGGQPKPIKLRIQADIQERAPGQFTKQQLSAFLRRFTGSHAYLNALVKATHRHDLDGQPVEELSDEHRQVAIEELTRRRANTQARQEQEQQQRTERATLLREFSETTLPPAEFAHSKGIALEALLPLLERARQEAHAPIPARDARRRPPRGPRHAEGTPGGTPDREARGPRHDGPRRKHGGHGGHGGPATDRAAPGASPATEGTGASQDGEGAPQQARPLRPEGQRPPRPQGDQPRRDDHRGPRRDGGRPSRPEGERSARPDAGRGDGPRRDRPRDGREGRNDRPRDQRGPDDRGPRPNARQEAPGPTAMANALAAVRDALKKSEK